MNEEYSHLPMLMPPMTPGMMLLDLYFRWRAAKRPERQSAVIIPFPTR